MSQKTICENCANKIYCYKNNTIGCSNYSRIVTTNKEWLDKLSITEKAKWICNIRDHCYECGAKRINDVKHCPFGMEICMTNPHEFELWLESERKEE